MHSTSGCTRRNDKDLGKFRLLVFKAFPPEFERTTRQVHLRNGFSVNHGPETLRLRTELVHDLGTANPIRESREIFHISSSSKLSTGSDSICKKAFVHHWFEVRSGQVNSGSVASWTGSNDDLAKALA